MAIGAVLSIAQAAVGFSAAQQQANEQNAYYDANRKAAIAAANDRYAALNNKTLQEREAASGDLLQKRIEATKARATAKASAAESGVTGLSVAALMGDFHAQQARQEQAILTNYQIRRQSNEDEGVSTYHNTIGRINSVRQASGPNPASYILQGLGGAVGAFSKSGGLTIG